MKPNVGPRERYVRIAVGVLAGLAALKFRKSKTLNSLLSFIAVSGIQTGLTRYCAGNAMLGIDNAPSLKEPPVPHIFHPQQPHIV